MIEYITKQLMLETTYLNYNFILKFNMNNFIFFFFKSEDNLTNKTFEESNQYSRRSGELPKRLNFPDGRSVCNMYLKIDPFLYEEVYNNEGNQVKIKSYHNSS